MITAKQHRYRTHQRRSAYVLIMCLLVIAISSSIVMTLFHILRLQTAEAHARRQLIAAQALVDAGHEYGVAVLIDQPSFRGLVGPSPVVGQPGHSYSVLISDASGDIQLAATGQAGSCIQTRASTITAGQLSTRRSSLGLPP